MALFPTLFLPDINVIGHMSDSSMSSNPLKFLNRMLLIIVFLNLCIYHKNKTYHTQASKSLSTMPLTTPQKHATIRAYAQGVDLAFDGSL